MASEESAKFSSTLKVPPLKIVFSSNHNNAVVNISSSLEDDNNHESSLTNNKKSQEVSVEQVNDSSGASNSKESNVNANQRITRSSQRAAQQNKSENSGDQNGDESIISENQDKAPESARKAKRRKAEVLDTEQDGNQASAQPSIMMANIYPSDYQLPSQNSFELYRDIRKRPYKKLLKLSHIQPRVPHGFKDYLLSSGPYLLDGNKLGVGLNGAKIDNVNSNNTINNAKNGSSSSSRVPLRMKFSNLQKMSSYRPSQQRHIAYTIPKPTEAPKSLIGSPLHELFLDQEKARQQMRMQHLKERERSILTAEQEILRAYNKTAIADVRQKLHLSACTYFYYQERYHYLDEKTCTNGNTSTKEVPHSQDNSFLCIEGGDATKSETNAANSSKDSKNSQSDSSGEKDITSSKSDANTAKTDSQNSNTSGEDEPQVAKEKSDDDTSKESDKMDIDTVETTIKKERDDKQSDANGDSKQDTNDGSGSDCDTVMSPSDTNSKDATEETVSKSVEDKEPAKVEDQAKNLDLDSDNSISEPLMIKEDPTRGMSDEDLQLFNRESFINQLQEIDDKWDKIKNDMLVRHRNEADSLHAVQTLEWEWKAKEIGACDVRVSLRIEPEFVPRVEVAPLDY